MNADELKLRLDEATILPILTVRSVDGTLRDIERLVAGGIRAVEIVFRTEEAAEALRLAKARFPDGLFGAGTMLKAETVEKAIASGADFLVSPGLTPALHEIAERTALPFIPGVQTASEVMLAAEWGYRLMKYYPAEASNGPIVLSDYANVFPEVSFVPTGKIGPAQLTKYGALRNVVAVGGSWMLAEGGDARIKDDIAAFRAGKS